MSFDVRATLANPEIIAFRCAGDDWPRSLLDDFPVPAGWMGVVERVGGPRRFLPANERPNLARHDAVILMRDRVSNVPLSAAGRASCGYDVQMSCTPLLRWQPQADDLAALAHTLLAPPDQTLTPARLTDVVTKAAAPGLLAALRKRSAEEWLSPDAGSHLLPELRAALAAFCFNTGAHVVGLENVAFRSDSWRRAVQHQRDLELRQQRQQARAAVEQAAFTAAQRRLDDVAVLMKKLQSIASPDAQVRWHDLAQALSPIERASLLENLWRVTPDRAVLRSVVLVGGSEIAWIDPATPDRLQHRRSLPDQLGGLRSVSFDPAESCLLVGAALGVWKVPLDASAQPIPYPVIDPGFPRTGFNAVIQFNGDLYASHSTLGCWRWTTGGGASSGAPSGGPAVPTPILRPVNGLPGTLRSITHDGAAVYFCADDAIYTWSPDSPEPRLLQCVGDTLHVVRVIDGHVYVGTADGRVLRFPLHHPDALTTLFRCRGPVDNLELRRWTDLLEIIIPAGPLGVCGVYGDDGVVTRLMEPEFHVRRVAACDDALIAMSEGRDRLMLLSAQQPGRHGIEIRVGRLFGASLQDFCLITNPVNAESPPVETTPVIAASTPMTSTASATAASAAPPSPAATPQSPAPRTAIPEMEISRDLRPGD